jgi:sugar phosphate isomerase/epimerase
MSQPVLGLQLFTVREQLAEDFDGTLQQVADMGYEAVELTGTGPHTPAELRKVLDEVGLEPAGMHCGLDKLESDPNAAIETAKALGMNNLVCPYLPDDRRESREDWLDVARSLDEIGQRCREAGLQLSYHNHSFEFVQFDGAYALDMMLENCGAENVHSELDTYWVKHGGADPVDYINKYAGRIDILHLKDMADDEEQSFAEVGSGILNWPAIDGAARAAGIRYYCVEQDRCEGNPMDSARTSAEFVRGLLE